MWIELNWNQVIPIEIHAIRSFAWEQKSSPHRFAWFVSDVCMSWQWTWHIASSEEITRMFKCLSLSVTFTLFCILCVIHTHKCTVCTSLLWKLLIIKQTFSTLRILGHMSWGQVRSTVSIHSFMPKASLHALLYTHTHVSLHTLIQTITKLISKQIFRTLWTCPKWTVGCLSVCLCFSHIYPCYTRADIV